MNKDYFFIILLLLLLFTACSRVPVNTISTNNPLSNGSVIDEVNPDVKTNVSMPKDEYFIDAINKCDRFRPIFEKELLLYPTINSTMDLSLIYSLIYQESACETRDELEETFKARNDTRETWKGGLMQVDSCWRCITNCTGFADCSTIESQIHNGMSVLNDAILNIDSIAAEHKTVISLEQKIYLTLLAYNRGSNLIEHAFDIYSNELDKGSYQLSDFVIIQNSSIYAFVNCTEKPLCTNDQEYIPVENYSNDSFIQSILIGCRMEYGFMRNAQGDYCTGIGYGLEYPNDILKIHQKILLNAPDIDLTSN